MLIVVFHIYDDKRLLMFNGKNIGIEINKNIWIQLPESLKKKYTKLLLNI